MLMNRYSAIDMSTFEALKLAYLKSTGKEEPGVLATLAFGSVSGSVGATSVYPMNLVRTRLQASGSSGHPQLYTGVWDVVSKTFEREGWRGFYRGLFPTLAKVRSSFVCEKYSTYSHRLDTGRTSSVHLIRSIRAQQASVSLVSLAQETQVNLFVGLVYNYSTSITTRIFTYLSPSKCTFLKPLFVTIFCLRDIPSAPSCLSLRQPQDGMAITL